MNYSEKYYLMREWVEDNILDVGDLIALLDISIEDVIKVFPDKLVDNYGKIFPEEDEQTCEGIGETWQEDEASYFDEDEES
jgi:hypothetical protein